MSTGNLDGIIASPGCGYKQNGKIHRIWHLSKTWSGYTYLDLSLDPAKRTKGQGTEKVVEIWVGERCMKRVKTDSHEVALAGIGIKAVPFGRVSRPRRKKQIPSMEPFNGSALPSASSEDILTTQHNITQQYRLNQEMIRYLKNPDARKGQAEYILMRAEELLADMPFWLEDLGDPLTGDGKADT